jgi:hypothetical protein
VKELAARLDDLFRLLTGGRCTALSSGPAALPSLKAFAGSNRILFGSDFPYVSAGIVASFTGKLDAYGDLTDDEHRAINHGNACALFSASGPKARHGASKCVRPGRQGNRMSGDPKEPWSAAKKGLSPAKARGELGW